MSNVELIAEVSTNHGGDLSLAKEFIHAYAEAGATWVKFQHTRHKHLSPLDYQYHWFQRSEFTVDQFAILKAYCEKHGTKFLTTVYNVADVPEVLSLGLTTVKIGSGEVDRSDLVYALSREKVRIIQSLNITGKVNDYLRVDNSHSLLACVTRYPASERACLAAIDAMYDMDGYSDHSEGIDMAKWAIERGARIIEKHVCYRGQARPAARHEATETQFKELRRFIDDGPERFIGRWQHA